MTATALIKETCFCSESMISTGDLCDFCDEVMCSNCGEFPKLGDHSLCGACLDDCREQGIDLAQLDRDESDHQRSLLR